AVGADRATTGSDSLWTPGQLYRRRQLAPRMVRSPRFHVDRQFAGHSHLRGDRVRRKLGRDPEEERGIPRVRGVPGADRLGESEGDDVAGLLGKQDSDLAETAVGDD